MNREIDSKELQQLSEYLDGTLSEKERTQLKARLQANPELRKELEDLSRIRLMLKSLPAKRAPRNFFLSPEMVGKKAACTFYPIFGLATAVAAFLFIFVLAGNFIWAPLQPQAASKAVSVSAVQNPVTGHQENSQAYLVTWATPTMQQMLLGARGLGGGGGDLMNSSTVEGATPETSVPNTLVTETPEEPTPTPSLGSETNTLTVPEENTATIPEATQPLPPASSYSAANASEDNSSGPILGINPTEAGEGLVSGETSVVSGFQLTAADFHITEGTLALLMVLGGLVTLYFYRKER